VTRFLAGSSSFSWHDLGQQV